MWKRAIKIYSLRDIQAISRRTYLAESYKLNQEWADRLKTPLLQKVKAEDLFIEIESKFHQRKEISPVDVDIYANKINDGLHMDEIADLLQKLRTTAGATKLFDSTQHALIRNYIENNNMESLVHVLDHRSQFGVFLDYYSANMLLDKLITEKNYKLGARFSTIFALQEEFENPITTLMMVFTCYKFLDNLETFDDLIVKPIEEEEEEKSKSKKKKDEIKVRLDYLINPFFDDHFDLRNTNHLMGKTFLYLADEVESKDEALANSLKLLGYSLYEKFEAGNNFLVKAKQNPFYTETVAFVKNLSEKVENIEENEPAKQFFETVGNLSSLKEGKVEDLIENLLKNAVKEQETKDIEEQKKIYLSWIQERDVKLDSEVQRFNRIERLLNAEKIQEDLKKEEKKLWFFENEDKIDMEIEAKKVFYPKRWFGKIKKPRVADQNYIPPDVDARRNVK